MSKLVNINININSNIKSVKSLRKALDLSQEETAAALNIHINTYRNKENGQSEFKPSEAFKLSQLFNVQMEDIFLLINYGKTVKLDADIKLSRNK